MTPPPLADLIERLVQLAEAATPGEWHLWCACKDDGGHPTHSDARYTHLFVTDRHSNLAEDVTEADGRFIAAANPEAIKLLCATLTAQAEEIRALREALEAVPSDMDVARADDLVEAISDWWKDTAMPALTQGAER